MCTRVCVKEWERKDGNNKSKTAFWMKTKAPMEILEKRENTKKKKNKLKESL